MSAELEELREAVCYVCKDLDQVVEVLALMEPGSAIDVVRGGDKEGRPDPWYVAGYHRAGVRRPRHQLCDRHDV